MADKCLICGEEFQLDDEVVEDMWEIREEPEVVGQPVKVLLHKKHQGEDLEQYKPKMSEWARWYLFGKLPEKTHQQN